MRIINKKGIILAILVFMVFVPTVIGHTPLNPKGDNHSLETAIEIENPTKSWTLYEEIHEPRHPLYYKLHLNEGELLRVSLFVPVAEDEHFLPRLIVLGPDLSGQGNIPSYIESTSEYASVGLPSFRAEPEFEPFTPASYYYLSEYEHIAETSSDYYIVVYEPEEKGKFGLAIGNRETYTLLDWIRIPLDLIRIRNWEMQSPFIIFGPLLLTFIAVFGFIYSREKIIGIHMWLAIAGGSLFIGSSVEKLVQVVYAQIYSGFSSTSILTLIIIVMQFALGYYVLRRTINERRRKDLIFIASLIGYGIIGFFVWAGLIIGPSLIIASAVIRPFTLS
ncbi:hypothetical protein GF319_08525 [Candidatus Bathyarchaeota archaeon]|nr:hypothetical protein [Candidatus Bathyarchaeota archaeon]